MREETDEEAGRDYLPPHPKRHEYRFKCLELAGGDIFMADQMFRWLVQEEVTISGTPEVEISIPDALLPVDEKGEEE